MTALEIINKYISFFEKRGHKRIANSPLVPQNDPTTLFTSSGMQPLAPYFLGEEHPMGKRLVNVQNCFRAQDIDEIGDNHHTTFFRMLGNWSLGDYFKKEQLPWFFEFLTDEKEGLGLDPQKLYVTVFKGNNQIPKDQESMEIWQKLFKEKGINAKLNKRIFLYDVDKNWWSRSGTPDKMPINEPGGPDSEVFYDFGTPHTTEYGRYCHPNCECGRFMEIGNSVFMQYKKSSSTKATEGQGRKKDSFIELPQKNVDFGGGLERLVAATENQNDIFQTNLFSPIIKSIELTTGKDYVKYQRPIRIIADHLIASTFIIANNIKPSNKEQGYVLRRLIRRSVLRAKDLGIDNTFTNKVVETIMKSHFETDPYLEDKREETIKTILEEENKFRLTLKEGLKQFEKYVTAGKVGKPETQKKMLSPKDVFFLYETYGFPYELTKEEGEKRGIEIPEYFEFVIEYNLHRQLSRNTSSGMFKGGLADHQEKTIMGHTATHLLHQALRDVLGNYVHQTGSNITSKRLRFDFNYDKSLTDAQLNKMEEIVNQKIRANLPVHFEMLPLKEAKKIGAIGLFDDKYAETVKIYFIGPKTKDQRPYSIEFCGGPHVEKTSKVGKFSIIKQENIGSGKRRIYSKVD